MCPVAADNRQRSMSITAPEQPTVFVVDDHAVVREGVKQLLESAGLRCEVFTSAKQFLERRPTNGPSCLVLDVRLPGMSGLDLQTELARGPRNIPIIMMTGFGDIPMSVQVMKAGAVSFLTKPVPGQELLDAVYAAIEKDQERLEREGNLSELRERYDTLIDREREILPLITAGLLNKQIAAEVGLSEVTVKVHRAKLMTKLNARTLVDLVRMAEALNIRRNGSGRNG
jgi:FixJ family two-component response regulator